MPHAPFWIIALLLWPAAAVAQQAPSEQCAPLPYANLTSIEGVYGEANTAIGITKGGWLLQHWVNAQTGSWTTTIRSPKGTTCLLAAGQGWREVERIIEKPET